MEISLRTSEEEISKVVMFSENYNDPKPGEPGNAVINDEGTGLVEISRFILKGSVVVANLGELSCVDALKNIVGQDQAVSK